MIRIRSLSDFLKCKCFLKHHHCTKQAEQIQTAVLDFIIFTCDLHAGWEISVHFTLFHVIWLWSYKTHQNKSRHVKGAVKQVRKSRNKHAYKLILLHKFHLTNLTAVCLAFSCFCISLRSWCSCKIKDVANLVSQQPKQYAKVADVSLVQITNASMNCLCNNSLAVLTRH